MLRGKSGLVLAVLLTLVLAACSPGEGLPGGGTGGIETLPAVTEEGLPDTGVETTPATPLPGVTEDALPGTGAEPTQGAPEDLLPPAAVQEAQRRLSESLNLPVEQLEIVSMEQVEWRDSCLELGGPQEQCAQVITSGWHIILRADGQEYEVRTDELGAQVRWAPRSPSR